MSICINSTVSFLLDLDTRHFVPAETLWYFSEDTFVWSFFWHTVKTVVSQRGKNSAAIQKYVQKAVSMSLQSMEHSVLCWLGIWERCRTGCCHAKWWTAILVPRISVWLNLPIMFCSLIVLAHLLYINLSKITQTLLMMFSSFPIPTSPHPVSPPETWKYGSKIKH